MELTTLLPLLLTGAGTGLTCGVSCGACGNPMVNVFLAGYLFTHTGQLRKSMLTFLGFHLGKAISVMGMCALISGLGSAIVDDSGNLFGIPLQKCVYAAMLVFMLVLILRWFRAEKCSGSCRHAASDRFLPMLAYGILSGLSPCASLAVVLGYASALTAMEAVLVGLCFSLANSLIPLLLLVALTGLLSRAMYKEIPTKIKYFQLATYMIFAAALAYNLIKG